MNESTIALAVVSALLAIVSAVMAYLLRTVRSKDAEIKRLNEERAKVLAQYAVRWERGSIAMVEVLRETSLTAGTQGRDHD